MNPVEEAGNTEIVPECCESMIEDWIVSHDHLRITGRRIAWYYDSAAKKFRDGIELGHRTGKGLDDLNKAQIVVLEMALPPTPDQEQIEALFKKISMELTPAMIVPMPERPVPAPEAEAQSTSEGPHTEARPGSPIARVLSPRKVDFKDPALPEPLPGEFSAGPGFYYHVGNGVSAPKPLYTPAPQFSEMARRFAFQGVVVLVADIDAEGRVAGLQVLHSIGMGLDAKALEMVRTWKFGPSLKDGVPVPTQMNIEVSFNLY